MSEQMNIEQLMRSKLEGQEITPSPGTFRRIRRRMRWKQFLRFDPGRLNIFYVAGILVIGGGLIALLMQDPAPDVPDRAPSAESPAMISAPAEEIREQKPAETRDAEMIVREENISSAEGSTEERDPVRESSGEPAGTEEPAAGQEVPRTRTERQSEQAAPHTETERQSEQAGPVEVQPSLIPYFTTSAESGCAPLTVQFFNQSVNHSSVSWSMGTGVTLTGENPEYTFTRPGRHQVTMTVMDEGGQSACFSQSIRVYPVPEADFEVEVGIRDNDGPKTYDLINYSTGATSYRWDLTGEDGEIIPGWSSGQFQPSVPVEALGDNTRYIRLTAESENGCSKTTVREIPEAPGTEGPPLRFPTAFSPNPAGPTGGHYSPHEKRNDVFYPVFETAPMEYRLRIFNRRGELVFETDDIYQGWDGYHLQEKCAAGVYVWMAEGKKASGEEFRMQGDVTLVRSNRP
ncbi:MAG: PKD domain-containing protein [Bacteroidota bacterium]